MRIASIARISRAIRTRAVRIRSRLRDLIAVLAAEHTSAPRLLAACVLGGMVGATPLFGLHFPLCVLLAMGLRLNRATVYGAAHISIPPLVPFVAAASIAVGSCVARAFGMPLLDFTGSGRTMSSGAWLDGAAFASASPWALSRTVFLSWLIGAPFVGGTLGAGVGAAVVPFARLRRSRAPGGAPKSPRDADPRRCADALRAAVALYADAPPTARHYVVWKTRLDPAYSAIATIVEEARPPEGATLVDLGAGFGVLAHTLALLGPTRNVFAIDLDAAKVNAAKQAARHLPEAQRDRTHFAVADLREWSLPRADVVVLLDVLHYVDGDEQRALLARVATALAPGGTLVVREADRAHVRGAWSRGLERAAIRLGWNLRASDVEFRGIETLAHDIEALGFHTYTRPLSGALHPGNALIVGTKKPATETSCDASEEVSSRLR